MDQAIIIINANEGNLKNISLEIPKEKLVVFTGLSGSGKSTLAIDTLYQECQRQYLEAIGYQGIQKPKVDSILNLSPAIRISQSEYSKNPRSSVGTITNIYTDLRMIFEKLHHRSCPNCKNEIISADCAEVFEKNDSGFNIYMICNQCGYKMDKLTRTYFSYNTREGACEACHGLGETLTIHADHVIQEALSLEEGAIDYWGLGYQDYQITLLYKTFKHYGIPYIPNIKVCDFDENQKNMLLYGFDCEAIKLAFPDVVPPKTVTEGKFEGVYTNLWRRLSEKGGIAKQLERYFESETCPACSGERLSQLSREVTVMETRLPELVTRSLDELINWMTDIENYLQGRHIEMVMPYLLDLKTKIKRIINVGLGYLSLDRQTMTLSGGEAQRIKLSAVLDSTLTGIIYIMDEPTIGLHPKDTQGIIQILKELRDLGNTVLIIEHDTDVMQMADYVIDIGPGSGKFGGEVIGKGTLEQLIATESSVTGAYLKRDILIKSNVRTGTGDFIDIKQANLYNLQNIDVHIPIGCLTSVTGVSGSGKSTLIFEVLAKEKGVVGLDQFEGIVTVEQSPLTRMKRSNVATYSGVYTEIRNIFGVQKAAKEHGLSAKSFSFNTKGGRCENCEGLGFVSSNMLFFEDLEVVCPVCGGNQFNDDVLSVKYMSFSIKDVLMMSIEEALTIFKEYPKIHKYLSLLEDVGLDYLELGQTLTTLSGGEGQRLKLAKELMSNEGKNNLYLIDEPTTGLHPLDVENFLVLLNRMVDSGNTVIIVEHNQQLIAASDWVVDLGPEGGIKGGRVIAEGTPMDIIHNVNSVTGHYLSGFLKCAN